MMAIAEAMIAAGARVVISSENAADTTRVVAELGQSGLTCDVTDDTALSENAYALPKAGVAQLARNLAVEWGPHGLRATAVSPGFIATELSRPLLDNAEFMARRMAQPPPRRPGTPAEVASAVVFLESPAASFITGHNLVVDGGTLIGDESQRVTAEPPPCRGLDMW